MVRVRMRRSQFPFQRLFVYSTYISISNAPPALESEMGQLARQILGVTYFWKAYFYFKPHFKIVKNIL